MKELYNGWHDKIPFRLHLLVDSKLGPYCEIDKGGRSNGVVLAEIKINFSYPSTLWGNEKYARLRLNNLQKLLEKNDHLSGVKLAFDVNYEVTFETRLIGVSGSDRDYSPCFEVLNVKDLKRTA